MEKFACPDCGHELTRVEGCGSVSYFCEYCKKLVSRKRIISQHQNKEKKVLETRNTSAYNLLTT